MKSTKKKFNHNICIIRIFRSVIHESTSRAVHVKIINYIIFKIKTFPKRDQNFQRKHFCLTFEDI